jgi:hypothetical protein
VFDTHQTWRNGMASSGKRKTTMAKLARERRLQEKRLDKQARKEARKLAAEQPDAPGDDEATGQLDEAWDASDSELENAPVLQTLPDA